LLEELCKIFYFFCAKYDATNRPKEVLPMPVDAKSVKERFKKIF